MATAPEPTVTTPATPVPAGRRNGMGTAALVLGVIAATFAVMIITFLLAALLGLLAVIFGGVGIARANRGEADNKRHATAGLVTGLLSLAFAVYMGIEIGTFVNDHQDDFRSFWKCITSAPSEGEQEDCASELGRRLD